MKTGNVPARRASRRKPSVAAEVVVMAVLICLAVALVVYLGAQTVPADPPLVELADSAFAGFSEHALGLV